MSSNDNLNDDVRYTLGMISGKLDLIMNQNAESDRRNAERFSKIEAEQSAQGERLDAIEKNHSKVLGGAAVVTTLFGAGATLFGLLK